MLKIFRKASVKWSLLVVTLVVVMGAITLTNAKADTSKTAGSTAAGSSSTATQTSSVPGGSFDYQKYLPFTPLLPSYTAGYQLTLSHVERSQNTPPGSNSITYLAAYGSHSAFVITEARPNDIHPAQDQSPKIPILIGDIQATMMEHDGGESIQFIKNGIEYIITSISGGGVSLDELKKISASIAVPAVAPPTEITIMNTGLSAADGLSFKAIQPGDISVPQGYQLKIESTNVDIKGDTKVETLQLNYKKGSSYLTIWESDGEHPFGDPTPVVTPESDFTSKQIDNTVVELRHSNNRMLPAAKFTLSQNGLQFTIFSDLPQSEVEKVATSILEASSVEQIQPNQVMRDGWNLTVTKTTLGTVANDQTEKIASLYITLANSNGADKAFSPKGKIVGVIGSSGKVYEISSLDSFDIMYIKGQGTLQMAAKQERKPYQPGIFKFVAQVYVGAGEQSITKVIYQDENENKVEIPITGAPDVPDSIPGGR